jgi:hypothetical protein
MRLLVRVASAFPLAAALALAASCGSDGGGGGSSGYSGSSGATWEDSEPVAGEVMVAWQDLDPTRQSTRVGLVNESSEAGRKLKSGQASSAEIRVLTDVQMGGLLSKLAELGFFEYATDGLALDNVPDTAGKKGIIVVSQDGRSKGLLFRTNIGAGPLTNAYINSKNTILYAHSQVIGFDVRANVGEPDERVFEAPPIRMKR